ncbi:MAG: cobalamin-binding protein [Gammaproteobacteria bacterium]
MLKFTYVIAIFFLWLNSTANACEVVDDASHTIKLLSPAKRIISLAPDLTELLFAAGAKENIVGVVKGSDYPSNAKKIPVVANFNHVDVERVLALHPDLIVVWAESRMPDQLKNLSVPIYVSHLRHITDVPRTLQRLGCLAGTEKKASVAARHFIQDYQQLQRKYSRQKTISVFYQIWPEPLVTVTQASWINEIIMLCGGKNIFANLSGVTPEVSMEAVLRANPDVIIGSETKMDWRKQWRKWPLLSAVKNNRLFVIDPDWVERAGPRILNGAEEMCRMIETVR